MTKARDVVDQLTLSEKAALAAGLDFWHTLPIERLSLPSVMLTDGPHGVRKQASDPARVALNTSVPTTCFPPACCSAASFDPELLYQIGVAIGEEAQQEAVAVVLGPGVNIKRHPRCGRNFEYFSEDPLLAGRLGAALIEGMQSQGVGTSVKHFAANNQETHRMTSNSVIDQRALHELYLAAFEYIVKHAHPTTVMGSYNLINGEYVVDSTHLLTEVLRQTWGFEGLVMSDWGAVNDRVKGLAAGLDLEMPGPNPYSAADIMAAVQDGRLTTAQLDRAVERIVHLVLTLAEQARPGFTYDVDAHHSLARRAAAESAVLLKNDGAALPLVPGQTLAVIGEFAAQPRYQGAGSSKIVPTRLDTALEAFQAAGWEVAYTRGYDTAKSQPDALLIAEAEAQARAADVAIVFAGLPDRFESEGFDRGSLDLPPAHVELIQAVSAANPHTVVVLMTGAPVDLSWDESHPVPAILLGYLGGQAGSSALVDVLTGAVNPSGKLPETWPNQQVAQPSEGYFATGGLTEEYRESIFVGYRYFATLGAGVRYPFGHGLSYTTFAYDNPVVSGTPGVDLRVTLTVTNTGDRSGAEVVQVYVAGPPSNLVFRPIRQLAGFTKVRLEPGQSAEVVVELSERACSYYNVKAQAWAVETGTYEIQVATSSEAIWARLPLAVAGDGQEVLLADLAARTRTYFEVAQPEASPWPPSAEDFTALYGAPLPPHTRDPKDPFTLNSSLEDIKDTLIGKILRRALAANIKNVVLQADQEATTMAEAMMNEMPLRGLMTMSQGAMTPKLLTAVLAFANGHPLSGLVSLLRR